MEIQSGRSKDKTQGQDSRTRLKDKTNGQQHLTEKERSNSAYRHIIHAPIEKVDIAGWLFTLPEAEYCRCCPPDHISCAATTTDDGKKMSINVEMIGKTLMIQHYVAETATATLCDQAPVGHF